jgi:hypothetical protein
VRVDHDRKRTEEVKQANAGVHIAAAAANPNRQFRYAGREPLRTQRFDIARALRIYDPVIDQMRRHYLTQIRLIFRFGGFQFLRCQRRNRAAGFE